MPTLFYPEERYWAIGDPIASLLGKRVGWLGLAFATDEELARIGYDERERPYLRTPIDPLRCTSCRLPSATGVPCRGCGGRYVTL